MTKRFGAVALAVVLAATSAGAASCDLITVAEKRPGGDKSEPTSKPMTFELAGDYQALRLQVPTKPVATTGTNISDMNLEVYAVQRSARVASVVLALHNTGDEAVKMSPAGQNLDENKVFDGTFVASNVAIVDTEGLKEYRSFVDENDPETCLCSVVYNQNQGDLEAGKRRYYVTQVAAPPAEVTQVNVRTGVGTASAVKIEG